MLKANIPVDAGNATARAGKLGGTIQSIRADLKPEAVYFTDEPGQRTAFIVLHLQDASHIPAVAELWCLACNASVEFHPVMIPEDMLKAGPAIAQAVNTYSGSGRRQLTSHCSGRQGATPLNSAVRGQDR